MLSAAIYNQCLKNIKDYLHISYDKDLIIDPNASEPVFIDGLQTLAKMAIFYNKNPMHESVLPLDFLKLDFERYDKTFLSGLWYDDVHLISYPPPEETEQFIQAACKFAQSVSFIMPKNAPITFPKNYQCLINTHLTKDMVFQIWLRADF
jgi:hypothetical protein